MHLEKIRIRNFKGIVDAELVPTSFSCLVGENNAGKSTVLQAIVHALRRPTQLPAEVFYDQNAAVELTVTFSDVTEPHLLRVAEEHRHRIADLVTDAHLTFIMRYRVGERLEIKTLRSTPIEPRYTKDGIDEIIGGKRGAAIKAAFVEGYPEFSDEAPDFANLGEARAFLAAEIDALSADQFHLVEGPLPSGIGSSIDRLLPEPIYIAAVKNLGDDLKTTQSTPFGRLLALLLEEMSPDLEQIRQSLADLDAILNRRSVDGAVVDDRHQRVKDLETNIQAFLRENFPTAQVELSIPPPELRAVLGSAQIYVDDGSRDLIDNKGDGIKRALTFALFQTLAMGLAQHPVSVDADDGPARQPLIFLFEEPELYLHPRSQRILFGTLAQLSQSHQMIVTTHSPIFFAPGVTATFVRVAKMDQAPKPVGVLYPINLATDAAKAETFRLARFENTDAAFFSRRVVLFEGESDDFFVRHVASQLSPDWDFDKRNIAMVRVSGKGNFARYRAFFEAFGIEVKILTDLDALFDGYNQLGASANATELRNTALQTIDARIAALGLKPELSRSQIKDKAKGEGFRTRYESARAALREFQATGELKDGTIDTIDALFSWEQDVSRVRACLEDKQASDALLPLLDDLRVSGICVLSRGAIEAYYPAACPAAGPKPQRALDACGLIGTQEVAMGLSEPLALGRATELEEIFHECFRGL